MSTLRRRATLLIAGLCLLAAGSIVFSTTFGSVPVPLSAMPGALAELARGDAQSLAATLIDLRLSRALVAFVTGAAWRWPA
jgi:iron complex transport system permease protein